jgi:hypothetical protein
MNLKKLSLICLALTMGTQALAANSIEFGFENEQYEKMYNDSDTFNPYVKVNLNPKKDSPLQLELKYMYFHQYGKNRNEGHNARFKTNKKRIEFFASGYKYKNNNFTFSPKIGFRFEASDVNRTEKPKSQTDRMFNLRLFPNMTYDINDKVQLYLNGFVGPQINRVQHGTRKDHSYDSTSKDSAIYWHDWYQEIEVIGVKYKLDNKDTFWTSLYNEYKRNEYKENYTRWQLRTGYNWNVNSKLSINPFIRYDLSYVTTNDEISSDHGKEKDSHETRIGSTVKYKIDPTLTLGGEIYWQNAKTEDYKGKDNPDKNRMFYKLSITKAF